MLRGTKDIDEIKVAIVTGGHPYDVPGFRDLFERMPQVRYFIQDLDNWAFTPSEVWEQYDVHLFYNMHTGERLSVRPPSADEKVLATIERLGETEQGILVLHHALLAFPGNRTWSAICNIQDRTLRAFAPNEEFVTRIACSDHPITRGLQDWRMRDELYLMDDAGVGSDVLLTTEHPKSMKTLGWAHEYKKARVFCYEGGHDNQTYTNPTFQRVLLRGIQWVAGRI